MTEVIGVKEVSIAELKEKAIELRKTAITMVYEAQSGHPGVHYPLLISSLPFILKK